MNLSSGNRAVLALAAMTLAQAAVGCDYCLMVSRPAMRPDVQAWAVALRDPLPTIPVPLRGSVPDASLNLQALLHEVYDAAGYEDYLYQTSPEPPLSETDAEWARQFVSVTTG